MNELKETLFDLHARILKATVSYSLADLRIVGACDLFRDFLADKIKVNHFRSKLRV